MGKRGPAPQPTNLKLLRGVDKKNPGRVNAAEPVPSEMEVAPPDWLGDESLRVWHAHAGDLEAKGVLTAWDVEAFACWCDAAVRRRRAAAALAEQGEVVEAPVFNKNGEQTGTRPTKNPWTLVLNESDAQVQRYGARFGLTPSDRGQLSIGDQESGQGAERLLS